MAKTDWRSFTFFDLRKDADHGSVAAALQDARITASTAGNGRIIIGDSAGYVHIFNRNWLAVTFRAHAGAVAQCELLAATNHLVTIGSESDGGVGAGDLATSLKCWNLSKPTADGGGGGVSSFACVRTSKCAIGVAVALAVAENGQCAAVGYDNGGIQLFRGDVKAARPKDPETTLKYGVQQPIVGMAFKMSHKTLQLFVCTETTVAVYVLPDRAKETLVVLDRDCKSNRCCVMQQQQPQKLAIVGGGDGGQVNGAGMSAERHFMVGQDDAVYCYNSDGRGPCYALKGTKSAVHWFRSHLLTVYQTTANSNNLTVIDIQNNVIGFEAPIGDVAAVLSEFGSCYLITVDRQVLHLDERDIRAKMNLLFKQSLYDVGVRIAKNNQFDDEGLAEIFKKYGDHLAQRGKHEEAVEQYIKTIGFLEPSYVIRTFLDPRHVDHLVNYLKALHERGVATANHTTLLLNCFTPQNKSDQLEKFLHVKSAAAVAAADNGDATNETFDVDVAIRVCRHTSPTVALTLARQHRRHNDYLAILVEDQHAYADALAYMRRLPFGDCEQNARRYGAILMEHCAGEMTELLVKLCTFYAPEREDYDGLSVGANGEKSAVDSLDIMRQLADATDIDADDDGVSQPFRPIVQRADAVSLMHLFGKRPDRMEYFLEHLVADLSCAQPTIIYNTLVELYVEQWHVAKSAETAAKIMDILVNHGQECDYKHALVLCRLHSFMPAVLHIYESDGHYQLVIKHYLHERDYDELLAFCTRLGAEHPDVWFHALNGLKRDAQCPAHLLAQVLQKIALGKQRSALQVLADLAIDGGPNLVSVRDYFQQVFDKEHQQIRKNEEAAKAYGERVTAQKREIHALTQKAVEFLGTTCLVCRQPLTMPAVYFLCKDSFHQDCLQAGPDADLSCPVCTQKPETLHLQTALQSQAESHDQHDQFHNLLNRSEEPFSLVSEYFGRGLFNQLVIVDENESVDINKNLPDEPPTQKAVAQQLYASVAAQNAPKTQAEAAIRVQESQHMRHEEAIKRPQLPEARMRLQESSKSSAAEQAAAAKAQRKTPVPAFRAPRKKDAPAVSAARNVVVAAEMAYDPAKNPFGEDQAADAGAVANAAAGKLSGSLAKEATTLNPFGEFDDDDDDAGMDAGARVEAKRKPLDRNLNPFE